MADKPLNPGTDAENILELISEIKLHLKDKAHFKETYRMINKSYQRKQFGYIRYETLKKKLLKDKSVNEWEDYYDAYIYGLLKRIDFYNSKVFYEVHSDQTELKLKIPKRVVKKPKEVKHLVLPKPVVPDVLEEERKEKERLKTERKAKQLADDIKAEEKAGISAKKKASGVAAKTPVEEGAVDLETGEMEPEFLTDIPVEDIGAEDAENLETEDAPQAEEIIAEATTDIPVQDNLTDESEAAYKKEGKRSLGKALFGTEEEEPVAENVLPWMNKKKDKSLSKSIKDLFKPKKSMLESLKDDEEDDTKLEFKDLFNLQFFKNIISRKGGDKFIGDETHISPSIIALKRYKSKEVDPIGGGETLDTSLLLQEAKRIKSIINKRTKFSIYEHSAIGTFANVMVKRVSLSLIETFPDFFKQVYDNLRLADIKILSNTYVNIMLLGVVTVSLFSYFLAVIMLFIMNVPLILIILRGFIISLLFGAITFLGFYMYPSAKIKQRRRSINTNLPFAINHMSAVASSGVPPEAMFRLIAESKEYQQISTELEKVSEYIDVFGYDIMTAVKSVSTTTPSEQLKEFFEGFVSSIETGGDLKHYLEMKAEEAMLQYKLERQKYTESISTYSDIYTGLLIAAPLFFVVALSLVSLLGGKIGGMEVESLIAIGTYIMIPLLNVAFIIFLQMSQPDV